MASTRSIDIKSIIERAKKDESIQRWIILAGDLDKLVADVLYHTVEEFITKEYDNIKEKMKQKEFDVVAHLRGLFDKKNFFKRSRWYFENNIENIMQNPVRLALVFCRYDVKYSKFSDMDASCLLQIIGNCNLFEKICLNDTYEPIEEVKKKRNLVMHNKDKKIGSQDFEEAFTWASKLLKDKIIESRWKNSASNSNSSIESLLESTKNMSSNLDISKSAILALENNLTHILSECTHISALQDDIAVEMDELIDIFLILVDKQSVEVSDDEASNELFKSFHKYKLELIRSSVSSLKDKVNKLESENLETKKEMKKFESKLESITLEIKEDNVKFQRKISVNSEIEEAMKSVTFKLENESYAIKEELNKLKTQFEKGNLEINNKIDSLKSQLEKNNSETNEYFEIKNEIESMKYHWKKKTQNLKKK